MSTNFYWLWLSFSKKVSWKSSSSYMMDYISTMQNTTLLRTSAFALPISIDKTSERQSRFSIKNWCSSGVNWGPLDLAAPAPWWSWRSWSFWQWRSLFWIMRRRDWSLGGCSCLSKGSIVWERKSEADEITSCSRRSSATWFVMHWCYGAILGE